MRRRERLQQLTESKARRWRCLCGCPSCTGRDAHAPAAQAADLIAPSPHRRIAVMALQCQKNTIPPSAKPFILACSPVTGLDVVRLSSPTRVTLFVSP